MAKFPRQTLSILVVVTLITSSEAASPFFLQAIASALGTIPFTAGPMTTGLVGAKLAVGSKLLYYLGFFGRRGSRSKPSSTNQRLALGTGSQFPGGMQAVPLPYAFAPGGFPPQFGGGFSGDNPNMFGQYPYGYDPAQFFQMLAAQGIDPTSAMQVLSSEGARGQSVPASRFPFPAGASESAVMPQQVMSQSPLKSTDQGSESDVESFFTFLRDMDDNTCISRLMCDIGSNPSFLGEFSENIHGIIGSLDVLPSSVALQYISVLEAGRREGGCAPKFPQCSDAAYEIVKNVAPSVGIPHNTNS